MTVGLVWLVALGTVVAAAVYWGVAMTRLHRLLVRSGLYKPPEVDDYLFRSKNGAYEKAKRQGDVLDPMARRGDLGLEAQRLVDARDVRLRLYIASLAAIVPVFFAMSAIRDAAARGLVDEGRAAAWLLAVLVWLWSAVLAVLNLRRQRSSRPTIVSLSVLAVGSFGAGLIAGLASWGLIS